MLDISFGLGDQVGHEDRQATIVGRKVDGLRLVIGFSIGGQRFDCSAIFLSRLLKNPDAWATVYDKRTFDQTSIRAALTDAPPGDLGSIQASAS